jgi:pimeloyl-ACP methyl ester carboxylesterase
MHKSSNTAVKLGLVALGTIGTLASMALVNHLLSKKAERDNPAQGDFLDIEEVRLHYLSRGTGPAIVFLHGNGSMIEDFECSGLMKAFAQKFRVLAFDRPGYGHSNRPRNRVWSPSEQASLIASALTQLEVDSAIVVGHSWGSLVATAMALEHPEKVKGLALLSGYYFPTLRLDGALAAPGAMPVLGDLLSNTIMPLIARVTWLAMVRNLFNPCDVPVKFRGFPKEMALRPSQLRASAQEASIMVPGAEELAKGYGSLTLPVTIICGAGDQIVDPEQSRRLHRVIRDSALSTLLFNGHMVHHTALKQVTDAIEELARRQSGVVRVVV